jgi:hypothetical protein
MMEAQPPEWIKEMIGFMVQLDKDLRASGELVFTAGLADGSTAKVVSLENGVAVTTDGPYAESKESIIGYWVLDVENESRILEIAGQIVEWSGVVEVRPLADAPPEV